jgi:hypothetical protein
MSNRALTHVTPIPLPTSHSQCSRHLRTKVPCYSQTLGPKIPIPGARYPRGITPFRFDVSRVIGLAGNTARCLRAGIRQGGLGRFEPGGGFCYPSRPRIRTYAREALQGSCVGRRHRRHRLPFASPTRCSLTHVWLLEFPYVSL